MIVRLENGSNYVVTSSIFLCLQSGGILLLTGPAGSGKSATLDVLSKELTIEVQEWVTPFSQTQQGNL